MEPEGEMDWEDGMLADEEAMLLGDAGGGMGGEEGVGLAPPEDLEALGGGLELQAGLADAGLGEEDLQGLVAAAGTTGSGAGGGRGAAGPSVAELARAAAEAARMLRGREGSAAATAAVDTAAVTAAASPNPEVAAPPMADTGADPGGGAGTAAAEELEQGPFPGRPHLAPTLRALEVAGECVSVTCPDTGRRAYCSVRSDAFGLAALAAGSTEELARRATRGVGTARGSLLTESVDELLARIEQRELEEAQQASLVAEGRAGRGVASGSDSAAGPAVAAAAAGASQGGDNLWVRKYAPAGYSDLLSGEKVNRGLMRWLKAWDHCVFGKPIPKNKADQVKDGGAGGYGGVGRFQKGGSGNTGPLRGGFKPGPGELDMQGRPVHKVVLLCGPPGLGKTTLAHVAAETCGYRVVEVNASDDRAAGSLRQRVMDAVQMRAVMGERKPNCVVLDEIDGALGGSEGKGAIAALLKIVRGGRRGGKGGAKGAKERTAAATVAKEAKKEGSGGGALQRPIICICNDPYVPALRALREEALVYTFDRTDVKKLSSRLRAICHYEGVEADGQALTSLCQQTECDIRACLNTLQFLQRQGRRLAQHDVHNLGIGAKDMTQSIFKVMDRIFLQQRPKRGAGAGHTGGGSRGGGGRALPLFSELLDFGDHQLVNRACHDNLHSVPYRDLQFKETMRLADWFSVGDLFRGSGQGGVDTSLWAYEVLPAVATHVIAAAPQRGAKLEFPREATRLNQGLRQSRSILTSFLDAGVPRARMRREETAALVVPVLKHLLNPNGIRPKDRRLMTKGEQAVLQRTIAVMLTYGLSFRVGAEFQDSRGRGPTLMLDPPVQKLDEFEGLPSEPWQLVSRPVRQILMHAVEQERILRRQRAASGGDMKQSPTQRTPGRSQHEVRDKTSKYAKEVVENAKRVRDAGKQDIRIDGATKKARPTTWLDAVRQQVEEKHAAMEGIALPPGVSSRAQMMPVLFKFHEGETAAVKTRVNLSDFL